MRQRQRIYGPSGDFNARGAGNDAGVWKGVIRQHGNADVNDKRTFLLQLCCNNALCIVNTFFQHKYVHKYTWWRDSLTQWPLLISA